MFKSGFTYISKIKEVKNYSTPMVGGCVHACMCVSV